MGKNQHVVPHGNRWAVKGEGNQRPTLLHRTQEEAEQVAHDIVRNQQPELFTPGDFFAIIR